MTYIATTLLYSKDLVERADPETGEMRLVERGYIQPGQIVELDEVRAEILLARGAIALPESAEIPAPEKTNTEGPNSPPDD